MELELVVAIDGPSGSGKSTIAKRLAQELGILYVDSGAMFRAIGYYCDQKKISFLADGKMAEVLFDLDFCYGESADRLVVINGENLTPKIREHRVSQLASDISKIPTVRTYLLNLQRAIAKGRTCVMEGRDIGTVIFPQAFCKFFMMADIKVRAQRRLLQLQEGGSAQKGPTLEEVENDLASRDAADVGRAVAPLKRAISAEDIDTTNMGIDAVVAIMIKKVREKAHLHGVKL